MKNLLCVLALLFFARATFLEAQTFTSVGPMLFPRTGNTATLLQDGTVLIAGGAGSGPGYDYEMQQREEIYTPGVGFAITAGYLHTPRMQASAFLASNGQALIVGGVDIDLNQINNIEAYNPVSQQFSVQISLPATADGEGQLPDGTLLIFYVNSSATSIYNPVANTLTTGPNDLSAATGRYIFKQPDGTLLVIVSGQVSRVYTASSTGGSFAPIGLATPTNAFESGAMGTLMSNGNVLFSGGNGGGLQGTAATTVWSPSTGFTPGPPMSSPRYRHSAVALLDGNSSNCRRRCICGEWEHLEHTA